MTGEDLYFLHRQALQAQGLMEKVGFGQLKPAPHWHELDEKFKQAWDETARQVNERQERFLQTMRRTHGRQYEVHGTPREGEGMLHSHVANTNPPAPAHRPDAPPLPKATFSFPR